MPAKKPSKYAAAIQGLPYLRKTNEDGEAADDYRDVVNATKDEITRTVTHTPESLAITYILARDGRGPDLTPEEQRTLALQLGKKGLESVLSYQNIQLLALKELLIASNDDDQPGWGMYGAGDNTVKLSNGATVAVERVPTGQVKDREMFRQWCLRNGLETSMHLHPKTMQSRVKELVLAGEPAPDGVEVGVDVKIVVRGL